MNVKEFLMKFDRNTLYDRYIELYPVFETYEEEHFGPEKVEEGKARFRIMFERFLSRVGQTTLDEGGEVLIGTKFVPSFMDDEEEISTWVSNREDIFKKAPMDVTMWNGDEESRIEHYAYDMDTLSSALSHEVFLYQVDELDAACDIINNLTFFGMEEEPKMERVKEILDSLENSVEEIKSGEAKLIPADEVFKELEEKILENASEEERIEILKEREEAEKNKARDSAFMQASMKINHIQSLQAVLSYYRMCVSKGIVKL